MKRFLEIAIESAFELETQLVILTEIKFVNKKSLNMAKTGIS